MNSNEALSPSKHAVYLLAVGKGAVNILRTLRPRNHPDLWLIALCSDTATIEKAAADLKFQLGPTVCNGSGTGATPEIGARAFEESISLIDTFKETKALYCVIAALGGGIGSGVSPLLADALKKRGLHVTALVTMPFQCEGKRRNGVASEALVALQSTIPHPVVLKHEDLLPAVAKEATLNQVLAMSNAVCRYAVEEIIWTARNSANNTKSGRLLAFSEILGGTLPQALEDIAEHYLDS